MNNRSPRDYVLLTVKGLAMGAADVVPGVSGGTIAFITGIYNELLHSLQKCGPSALTVLVKEGLSTFWRHINGNFLLAVFGGVLLSIKTFASVITYCLEHYPLLVWAFFSGLIVASVILLGKQQGRWHWRDWVACAFGVAFVYIISIAKPSQLPGDWWVLFFGGFIAICAMILPGVSGSFILLLLGLYSVFLEAITELNLVAIASFGAGCVCGLLCFSRFLSWLLDAYYQLTIAVLMGFLIGSLNVTWPWKEVVQTVVNRHGEVVPVLQKNVGPARFEEINATEPVVLYVILFAILGATLVLLTEFFATKLNQKNSD